MNLYPIQCDFFGDTAGSILFRVLRIGRSYLGKIPQAPYARENYGQIGLKKQVLAVKTGRSHPQYSPAPPFEEN